MLFGLQIPFMGLVALMALRDTQLLPHPPESCCRATQLKEGPCGCAPRVWLDPEETRAPIALKICSHAPEEGMTSIWGMLKTNGVSYG